VIFVPGWSIGTLCGLILLWGIGTGGLVLGFAFAREANPSNSSGLAIGLVNTLAVGSGAVFQLLIGFLLDLNWQGSVEHGVRVYELGDFRVALTSLMVMLVFGMLCILGIRRTPISKQTG
jgi:MFS family permease